jgi:hypothetical protein
MFATGIFAHIVCTYISKKAVDFTNTMYIHFAHLGKNKKSAEISENSFDLERKKPFHAPYVEAAAVECGHCAYSA